MKQFEIVTQPIETEQYRDFTINERQGAVVVFTGHVREWTKGCLLYTSPSPRDRG